MTFRLIIFLVINFAALALGGWLMGSGASSPWYSELNKAPWTPPGWSFGVAWSTIMICFAFYMTYAWQAAKSRSNLLVLYTVQWILNTSWSPMFFRYHQSVTALILITLLTLLITYTLFIYFHRLRIKSLFIAPYFAWLLIATSLNAYIVLNN